MKQSFEKILKGYEKFQQKYTQGNKSLMKLLAQGQQPKVMVVACCDSRVDPAVLFQCDPGDLFVVRNVANIIPPYEKDLGHHGVSAALEFGINVLGVEHLIVLGHSQCGGIKARLESDQLENDFLNNWLLLINRQNFTSNDIDQCAKQALEQSYQNAMQFPWIRKKVEQGDMQIHRWFFDIKAGRLDKRGKDL